jgi:Na+-transporting NADH:ubiquinone oxidoreductase subunit D
LDAVGNAIGYGMILIIISVFREFFGSGSLMGIQLLGDATEGTGLYAMGYMNNNMFILPPMALIITGIIIWVQRARNPKLIEN